MPSDNRKGPADRGVVDSIAALRLKRYYENGAGAAPSRAPATPTVDQLRAKVAKVKPKKRKKAKKRSRK